MTTALHPTPQAEPSYVAWMRSRQQVSRRRQAQLAGLQAQADPSEAPGIAGPITTWAEGRARDRRRQANAMAQLQRGVAAGHPGVPAVV